VLKFPGRIPGGASLLDIVVEPQNPRLEDGNLVYDVTVFIDVIRRPLTPLSVAGVSRRTSRRVDRRQDRRD
jgi:hypothetical protein